MALKLDPKVQEILPQIGIEIVSKANGEIAIYQGGVEQFSSYACDVVVKRLKKIIDQLSQDCVDLMQDLDPERYQQFMQVAQTASGWVMMGLKGDVGAAVKILQPQRTSMTDLEFIGEVAALADGAWSVIQSWGKSLP